MADLDAIRKRMKERKEAKVSSVTPPDNSPKVSQKAESHYHEETCHRDKQEGSEVNQSGSITDYLATAGKNLGISSLTDKLKDLGEKSGIDLKSENVNSVSDLNNLAKSVFDKMTERLRDSKPKSSSSNSSSGSNSVVYRKVVEILCNNLGIDKDEIKSDSRLDSDLGADSLDAVEIIMEIESTFDIDVPDKVAQKLRTVGDIVTYIETHRKRF